MFAFFFSLVVVALAVHLYREFWLRRRLPGPPVVAASAEVYQVGQTQIAVLRPEAAPSRTIVCMPGFLESSSYFLALYAGTPYELVLVNNADYHAPFASDRAKTLAWAPNPYRVGTIEHDAFIVGQAARDLASARDVVLHGHSRGGAVVLEAGRQFPAVMRDGERRISALLEAAVVPQGTPAGGKPGPIRAALMTYFLPIGLGLLRSRPDAALARMPMAEPSSEAKRRVLRELFANPKCYATCVTNIRDIWAWQESRGTDAYRGFARIRLLIGARDDVLDTETMRRSGEAGARENPGVRVVQTEGTNHFISLEAPQAIHAVLGDLSTG